MEDKVFSVFELATLILLNEKHCCCNFNTVFHVLKCRFRMNFDVMIKNRAKYEWTTKLNLLGIKSMPEPRSYSI